MSQKYVGGYFLRATLIKNITYYKTKIVKKGLVWSHLRKLEYRQSMVQTKRVHAF